MEEALIEGYEAQLDKGVELLKAHERGEMDWRDIERKLREWDIPIWRVAQHRLEKA